MSEPAPPLAPLPHVLSELFVQLRLLPVKKKETKQTKETKETKETNNYNSNNYNNSNNNNNNNDCNLYDNNNRCSEQRNQHNADHHEHPAIARLQKPEAMTPAGAPASWTRTTIRAHHPQLRNDLCTAIASCAR